MRTNCQRYQFRSDHVDLYICCFVYCSNPTIRCDVGWMGKEALVLGIVGSEGAKFTPETELKARKLIRLLIKDLGPLDAVCSGACHLGGVDVFAVEEARKFDIDTIEYPPKVHRWEGGYKQRNLQIAQMSDEVICIVPLYLPESYTGMKFGVCYHHDSHETNIPNHVKSGGEWTGLQAAKLGKNYSLIIIDPDSPVARCYFKNSRGEWKLSAEYPVD